MTYIQGEQFIELSDSVHIFYCKTDDVNDFFRNIPTIDPFILISHNSDGKITDTPDQYDADVKLMPNNLIRWFAQNVYYSHERIESIPIGLENSYNFPELNKIKKLHNLINVNKNYINLLYMNHNINTNPTERIVPYDLLENKQWCTSIHGLNGDNYDEYINNIHNHKFVISPEGNGPDTHRLWECLYLNTIPIEKRNINNQFYTDLPICFVDDWNEITEQFLLNEYDRITNIEWNLDKLNFSYWKHKITSEYNLYCR